MPKDATKMTSEVDENKTVEYFENKEEERELYIHKLQVWLQTQSYLNARTDSASLLRFLRGCKYNIEKTQRKITNYYTIRAKAPEWFKDRDPVLPELQELLNLGVFVPLLQRDTQGRLVVIIRAALHDPHFSLQSDVFKIGKMILDLVLEEDETIASNGVVAIIDLTGVTLAHAMQLTPSVIKKAVHTWQDCYPVSPKRLDFINAPMYVNVVLNIFRQFMREKIRKRIFVHYGRLTELHKAVPPAILPKEYGGTNKSIEEIAVYWKRKAEENRDWFIEDEKHKAILQQ